MKAVILAAGRGMRMGSNRPKCLEEVGGQPLLARMLMALASVGVDEAIVVVGFEENQVRSAVNAVPQSGRPEVTFITNDRFERGSLLSLSRATERFGEDDVIIMDADVLFPTALLHRLVASSHRNAFLMDSRVTSEGFSGEEMMLAARAGRVHRITRGIEPGAWEAVGEGVGFLKLAREDQATLHGELASLEQEGDLDREYEEAVDRFLTRVEVGYEDVSDLPWTEVDFPEDLSRARTEVLPAICEIEA